MGLSRNIMNNPLEMFKIAFILYIFLFSGFINAKIIITSDLSYIEKEILANPKSTLIVFDIDMVLIKPTDQVYLKYVNHSSKEFLINIAKDLKARHSSEEVEDLLSIIVESKPIAAATPNTVSIFHNIKAHGYQILGLTKCKTGKYGVLDSREETRIEELEKINLHFSNTFPDIEANHFIEFLPEDIQSKLPCAKNGIIFTNKIDKSIVLESYFKFAKINPEKIIFIDDKMDNIQSLEKFCKINDIEYIGFHYNVVRDEADKVVFDKRLAKFKFLVLEHTKSWLSDEQANSILSKLDNN